MDIRTIWVILINILIYKSFSKEYISTSKTKSLVNSFYNRILYGVIILERYFI